MTLEWCNIWEKTDLLFGNDMRNLANFTRALTEELCIMTMNNDTKIEEELTWVTSRVLTRALESLRNLYFNWLLVTKIYNAWATKVQRSYLLCHWRVMQILKKNWLLVWKMKWEIWQIFTRALKSVKIETSMGFFCPK